MSSIEADGSLITACPVSTEQLYAFCNVPRMVGTAITDEHADGGWNVYNPKQEYARMGVFDSATTKARTSAWRFTSVNANYEYCPTYPASLVVPAKISDATLNYGKAYRSKHRIPGLVYLHWNNLGTITRASQPMVGLKNNRSIQDEKLIEAIFNSHSQHSCVTNNANASYISHQTPSPASAASSSSTIVGVSSSEHPAVGPVYGATPNNLIIDARPTTNAMANVAKGAGTENMDYYRNCKKVYLGIDNIHVMRDSLAKVVEATRYPGATNHDLLRRSGWLRHLSCILEGIVVIVRAVHLANSHVLVHCSDGWDRTSQLSALSQVCLDPFYRTMQGLAVLIEKDWVSFGHRFADRLGHTVPARVQCIYTADEDDGEVGFLATMQNRLNFGGGSHAFKETCPVFDQFLDCIHQLQRQFPSSFEYNEAFLLELQKQAYECNFGNFLFNSEKERLESNVSSRSGSIWAELLAGRNRNPYLNPDWTRDDREVLFPDARDVQWWTGWFKCEDMNVSTSTAALVHYSDVPGDPKIVEQQADDPVLSILPHIPTKTQQQQQAPSSALSSSTDAAQPRSVSPGIRPLSLDGVTVAQASTAVQGAMRSAWSAWKSVKQSYEGIVKEGAEQQQHLGGAAHHRLSRPASPSKFQAANGTNIFSGDAHTSTSLPSPFSSTTPSAAFGSVTLPSASAAPPASVRASPARKEARRLFQNEEDDLAAIRSDMRESGGVSLGSQNKATSAKQQQLASALTANPRSGDQDKQGTAAGSRLDEDPLGVKVWS